MATCDMHWDLDHALCIASPPVSREVRRMPRESRHWLTGGLVTQPLSEMSSFSLCSAADVQGQS